MATLSGDVLNAFAGTPTAVTVTGPKSFLRAAGADNNPFGRWWFAAETLLGLKEPLERIPLPAGQRREALLGRIRAATAISVDWNTLSEFWMMQLPAGEQLNGHMGPTSPQAVFSVKHALHNAELVLAGGAIQYYFPVINPLWVTRFASFADL
jgi:hypothetical protein